MNYLTIYKDSISDGPGFRVSLYVSGCRNHCPGCHNPESWDFKAGKPFDYNTLDELLSLYKKEYITGLTIAGGEPMEEENQSELSAIVSELKFRYPYKTIWCYTGYELDDLLPGGKKNCEYTAKLLRNIDVLVTGPFIQEQRDITDANRWRGSRNQRVLDLPKTLNSGNIVYLEDIPNNE